jgi:hypothetical protein
MEVLLESEGRRRSAFLPDDGRLYSTLQNSELPSVLYEPV